jgi:hypothetical protein
MSPKPADRPSARQVLTSDLLPPRLEDEQLKDLLRSLPDNEIAYERVVDSLFSISTGREPQAAGLQASSQGGKGTGSGGGGGGGVGGAAGAAARAVQSLTPARAAGGVEGLHGAGLLASQQGALPLGELPGAPVDAHLDKVRAGRQWGDSAGLRLFLCCLALFVWTGCEQVGSELGAALRRLLR